MMYDVYVLDFVVIVPVCKFVLMNFDMVSMIKIYRSERMKKTYNLNKTLMCEMYNLLEIQNVLQTLIIADHIQDYIMY